MAVKIRRISKANEELNMASISDIVFLLLIYFMVVTVFQQDIGLPFVLPAGEADSEVKIKQSNIAELVITQSNIVTIDATPIPVNRIKNELERRVKENPKLVVMLKTHPEADYGTMIAVLDEVRLAKCKKMALKTLEV